jgi:23S rRNA (guanine745-N1)-methyltransferase
MHEWFTCPECGRELVPSPGVLVCSSGHRFELGRRGYAALVIGRSALVRSDPAAVLDAVDARWSSGELAGVADAVSAELPSSSSSSPLRVLDCGGDVGHLLAAVHTRGSGLEAVYVSSSPSAVVRAMARTGAMGLLADPSRRWPVRDGVADVVLCAYADHRPAEFHRVLKPGGIAVLVTRSQDVPALDDDVYPWFEHDQTRTVTGSGGSSAVLRYRRRRRILSW